MATAELVSHFGGCFLQIMTDAEENSLPQFCLLGEHLEAFCLLSHPSKASQLHQKELKEDLWVSSLWNDVTFLGCFSLISACYDLEFKDKPNRISFYKINKMSLALDWKKNVQGHATNLR